MMAALTCYTTALHGYLGVEWDADSIIARSIRLAVRADEPDGTLAFSHHDPPLDRLPDGSTLRYAGASSATAALDGLREEWARHRRAVVVVDLTRLDWSVRRSGDAQPHWLLIDGRVGGRWHVVDRFAATMPEGDQYPYEGWTSDDRLTAAMRLPRRSSPSHRLRNALAFGAPVPVPCQSWLWLRRGSSDAATAPPGDRWSDDPVEVFELLRTYVEAGPERLARVQDDLWAAARHRAFAYRWWLARPIDDRRRDELRRAVVSWESVPRAVRFAVESARRGRSRPALVAAALDAVRQAEGRLGCLV